MYLNPSPDPRDLGAIYDYDVYEDSTNNNPALMEHFHATMVKHHPEVRRVMEIGCGTGDFLAWLQKKGFEVEGVEFADSAHRVKFDGPLHLGRMEDLTIPSASVDAVLLLNVIEHLSDPVAVLRKIHAMLRQGGVLLMRHPNAALFRFPPYRMTIEWGKYLAHRLLRARGRKTRFTVAGFQNQHLFYFTRPVVERILRDAGFEVVSFSTTDPYNRLRIGRALRRGRILESGIAAIRHGLSLIDLGPECLWVARRIG